MKKIIFILSVAIATMCLSSCHTYNYSMREPNVKVELNINDLELSEQFTAEAEVKKVLFIDWQRLFGNTELGTAKCGDVASIIGTFKDDSDCNYALYKLMKEHPGYDVIVYPQYETHKDAPILGTDLFSHKTVKVTARLGKLK